MYLLRYIWQNLYFMSFNATDIGRKIKECRESRNLTQKELANKVGKQRSYIARIEGEDCTNMNIKTLTEIVEKGFGGSIKIEF